ncbi:hemagglutinin repeat-containing protein [Pseudomonas sp.]|uniref:hemagglutinin repeat-containing protein n=1 Tax=Pseudomonas sp. TaxID=306 RepID=UPI0028A9D5F3|nr:hemagglutinin repeat-containing protein [Pseudomonas sp.]
MNEARESLSRRPDVLRWSIFLCLASPGVGVAADALQAIVGPGGTPVVDLGHGVPVIDIVAPNANGLSHNQFLDYNVGQAGVVLNNSLSEGQSRLAGALAGNAQFQGQAASTIINEVVSRNASLVEGSQEIFGRPADYILANPNGITVNGGQFINTSRASFLVGTPVIEDQQLKRLDTLDATGQLQVLERGAANSGGGLDLIAPKVASSGSLLAEGGLNVLVGRNRLASDTLEVLEHLPGESGSVDASLFGAMHAGRIRIISTAEGAGVRMGPALAVAGEELTVRSAGGLTLEGSEQRKSHLQVKRGDLTLHAAEDLHLSAVTASARSIDLKAGKALTLDGKNRETISRSKDEWNKKWWLVTHETYSANTTQIQRRHHGVMLSASDDIRLRAGKDVTLAASELHAADQLSVEAGGDLSIAAALDSDRRTTQIRHRKHLWRGDSDSDQYRETAVPSVLKGANVQLGAGGDVQITGSQVLSQNDLQISGRHVQIDAQRLSERDQNRDYRGDLVSGTFFGDRQGHDGDAGKMVGSEVRAGGVLAVTAERASIRGSEVFGDKDALLHSTVGALEVTAALGESTQTRTVSNSKLFGALGSRSERTDREQQVLSSDIHSRTNLRLASAGDLHIEGARVHADQQLTAEADGDLSIISAASRSDSQQREQQRHFNAHAKQTREAEGEKAGSRQFDAGVGYEVASTEKNSSATRQTASELGGASVALRSGSTLQIKGSKVSAEQGDLILAGQKVDLGVRRNDSSELTTRTESGGGLAVTGGIDRLGSAFHGKRDQTTTEHIESLVQRSELSAGGEVRIDAPDVVNEATLIKTGSNFKVVAERVENRAADDIKHTDTRTQNWNANLGASLEYRDITRPIERLVQGEEAARFQQASPEDAMAPPSIGADATLAYAGHQHLDTQTTAQATELDAGAIALKADTLTDVGTTYKASTGQVAIEAQQHHLLAAHDSRTVIDDTLKVDGGLRVDTSTGTDVNVRLTAAVEKDRSHLATRTAKVGSLQGQSGIQVQLGSDGLYEGTRLDGGDGPILIESAGPLTVSAASDSVDKTSSELDASLWSKGGNSPAKTGLDARLYGDHASHQASDRKAQIAQLDAKGDVTLRSGGDLTLEGIKIGRREAPVGEVTLDSAGVLKDVAAYDTHQAKGNVLGGGVELAGSHGMSSGGALGGHLTSGKVDEDSRTAQDPSVHSRGTLTAASQAREDQAIHLQGLQVNAQALALSAAKGGVLAEASSDYDRRDNLAITAGAGFNLSKAAMAADDVRGLHGRVKVELDKRDNLTWNDSAWRTDQVTLSSASDTRVEGVRVEAERIGGAIDGNLLVASRKDHVDSTHVQVDARLSHEKNPQGYLNAATSLAGPAGGKMQEKAGSAIGKIDPGLSPTLRVDASRIARDNVAQQSGLKGSDGIALSVAGDTQLVGARLQAPRGSVDLGASAITQQTLRGQDYRRDVGIDASNSAPDLGTAIAELAKSRGAADGENALDLGLLRTSGYSRDGEWAAAIQQQTAKP